MRPLRYSINITLDGCCDHRAIPADEELHRHAADSLNQADALLFGRVTYEMMESAWRPPASAVGRPDWMESFARTIDAAKKYVVSSTLQQVDWNAELVRGDLGEAVLQLKRESGKGLLTGGVMLPQAFTGLLFVALSMHLKQILSHAVYKPRAIVVLVILTTQIVISAIVLAPQPREVMGWEILVLNLFFLALNVRYRAPARITTGSALTIAFRVIYLLASVSLITG